MKRRLRLGSPAARACRRREVAALLDEQDRLARPGQRQAQRRAAHARADDDDVPVPLLRLVERHTRHDAPWRLPSGWVGRAVYTSRLVLAVLSFDSVSAPLVDELLSEGRLPNLADVRRRGRTIELREELPGAAYATLYTGRRLAEHGLYYPLQWSPAAQATLPWDALRAAEMERHSVFRRLAARGSRVLVLDPSECAPHAVDGGVLVSGLQMRSRILLVEWSRPGTGLRELAAGRAPRVDEVFGQPTTAQLLGIRRRLLDAPGRLAAGAERLLRERAFDLVWITFTACHQAGHLLFDPSLASGRATDAEARELRGALARHLRARRRGARARSRATSPGRRRHGPLAQGHGGEQLARRSPRRDDRPRAGPGAARPASRRRRARCGCCVPPSRCRVAPPWRRRCPKRSSTP